MLLIQMLNEVCERILKVVRSCIVDLKDVGRYEQQLSCL